MNLTDIEELVNMTTPALHEITNDYQTLTELLSRAENFPENLILGYWPLIGRE